MILLQLAGVRVEYYVQLCEAPYRTAWLVVLFGYKAVLQIIGVILAFRIRNVKVSISFWKTMHATLIITALPDQGTKRLQRSGHYTVCD